MIVIWIDLSQCFLLCAIAVSQDKIYYPQTLCAPTYDTFTCITNKLYSHLRNVNAVVSCLGLFQCGPTSNLALTGKLGIEDVRSHLWIDDNCLFGKQDRKGCCSNFEGRV